LLIKILLCSKTIKQNSVQIDDLCKERRVRVSPDEFDEENIYVGFEHLTSKNYWGVNHSNLDGVVSQKFRFEPDNILYGKIRPYLQLH
jgi:type I restriction enzyme S subunit